MYSKSWLKTLITFASPQPCRLLRFHSLDTSKQIPVIVIFTIVQAPNFVRHMLLDFVSHAVDGWKLIDEVEVEC